MNTLALASVDVPTYYGWTEEQRREFAEWVELHVGDRLPERRFWQVDILEGPLVFHEYPRPD